MLKFKKERFGSKNFGQPRYVTLDDYGNIWWVYLNWKKRWIAINKSGAKIEDYTTEPSVRNGFEDPDSWIVARASTKRGCIAKLELYLKEKYEGAASTTQPD